jgi:aryl-alcohol dehydrogenase-like predicted oxidoreductase
VQLIAQGKVRYIAASNFSPERLAQSLKFSADNSIPSYVAVQDHYNLMHRSEFESNQAPLLEKNSITCIPYFGLARGFLTGKYRAGVTVDSMRAGGVAEYQTEKGYAVVSALEEISKVHNSSIAAVALAWLRAQPQVSTPIASARTVEQLEEIIQVVELTSDEVEKLTKLSL